MPPKPSGLVSASVVRVVDGDTIVVSMPDGRRERIRLIGIDTPEIHTSRKLERDAERSGKDKSTIRSLGAKASKFAREHLSGRQISIEIDTQRSDKYQRMLAYVWIGEDLFNAVIVRDGYAALMRMPPNVKYSELLAACYQLAREDGRGLWGLE